MPLKLNGAAHQATRAAFVSASRIVLGSQTGKNKKKPVPVEGLLGWAQFNLRQSGTRASKAKLRKEFKSIFSPEEQKRLLNE